MTHAAPNMRVETRFGRIVIYFGDTLHVSIARDKLLGVQSWRLDDRNYRIEYTMDGGAILSEYDDRAKWEFVLKGLEPFL